MRGILAPVQVEACPPLTLCDERRRVYGMNLI